MTVLSNQQIEKYIKEGFLILRGLFGVDDIAMLRNESERLWSSVDIEESSPRVQWRKRIDGGKTADRIDPVLDISPIISATAWEQRLIGPVGELLRCAQPQVFKAKLISKWPGTCGYTMHQDFCYWQDYTAASPDDFVTVLLALDYFDTFSGTVEYFPGQHHNRIPSPPGNPNDVDESKMDVSNGVLVQLDPGDIVFFHGLAPHRSGPNLSELNRQSLFLTYVTPEHADITARYYAGRPADFIGAQ
jgi:2-aminoethylphosphonate dioxygenase